MFLTKKKFNRELDNIYREIDDLIIDLRKIRENNRNNFKLSVAMQNFLGIKFKDEEETITQKTGNFTAYKPTKIKK